MKLWDIVRIPDLVIQLFLSEFINILIHLIIIFLSGTRVNVLWRWENKITHTLSSIKHLIFWLEVFRLQCKPLKQARRAFENWFVITEMTQPKIWRYHRTVPIRKLRFEERIEGDVLIKSLCLCLQELDLKGCLAGRTKFKSYVEIFLFHIRFKTAAVMLILGYQIPFSGQNLIFCTKKILISFFFRIYLLHVVWIQPIYSLTILLS